MSLFELATFVKTLFDPTAGLEATPQQEYKEEPEESSFAKRLITERATEEFFRANYGHHEEWRDGNLVDTTSVGCGFDFRINFVDSTTFHTVEVKNMFGSHDDIMLTEKEYRRADQLRERFFLYVVRNFKETPFATV